MKASILKQLAVAVVVSMFLFVVADVQAQSESWPCGWPIEIPPSWDGSPRNNVMCSLDEDGIFSILGTGGMFEFFDGATTVGRDTRPWRDIIDEIKGVVVGNGVSTISSNAFSPSNWGTAKNLASLTISNSVTSIGAGAFAACSSLTEIIIPYSVTSIGNGAFSGCTGLTSIRVPSSVTHIGAYAFSGCTELTSVTIPNGPNIAEIDVLFQGCYKITTVSNGATTATLNENTLVISGVGEMSNCLPAITRLTQSSIKNVVVNEGVTSIVDYAFAGTDLASIDIPNSVTSIGKYAFARTGLMSIDIPNNVTSIGEYAFSGCVGLTEITLPNSLLSIGDGAFSGCTGLTSIYIGSELRYLEHTGLLASLASLTDIVVSEDNNY